MASDERQDSSFQLSSQPRIVYDCFLDTAVTYCIRSVTNDQRQFILMKVCDTELNAKVIIVWFVKRVFAFILL